MNRDKTAAMPMTAEPLPPTVLRKPYLRRMPEAPATVKELVLAETDGGRMLLLQWQKETDAPIRRLAFEVVMLDPVGEELGRIPFAYTDSDIPPCAKGQTFTPPCGIPVDIFCADAEIRLTEIRSESYVYRYEGGRPDLTYEAVEPWSYDPHAGEREGLSDTKTLRVQSVRKGRMGLFWPIALAALLILLLVILRPYLPE